MGIDPLIMLMPGHAFLAWSNKTNKNKMGFLDKFILKGAENFIPIFSTTFSKEKYSIVDLEEVRSDGIYFTSS